MTNLATVSPPAVPAAETVAWPRVRRWEYVALVIVLALFFGIAAFVLAKQAPLGHDEAVYALRARAYAGEEVGGVYWADYRAPGLSSLMRVAYDIKPSATSLRVVPLLMSAVAIVLTWMYGRHLLGRGVGVVAAGLLAVTPGFMRYAWQIALDIPGSALALASIVVFLLASARDRIRPWALAVIPIAGFATAVRYGVPFLIGSGLGLVAVVRWRTMLRSWGLAAATLGGAMTAMAAVLVLPFLTGSTRAPIAAFRAFRTAKGNPFGKAYREFVDVGPPLLGRFIGYIVLAGLILAVVGMVRGHINRRNAFIPIATLTAFVIGLGIALGQGEGQYLTPGLPFLHVFAAAGLVWLFGRTPRFVGVTSFVVLLAIGSTLTWNEGIRAANQIQRGFGRLRSAAIAIGTVGNGACIAITSYSPQVGWYSGCSSVTFPDELYYPSTTKHDELRDARDDWLSTWIEPLVGTEARVMLFLLNGGKRQPEGAALDVLRELVVQRLFEFGDPDARKLWYIEIDELDRDEIARIAERA